MDLFGEKAEFQIEGQSDYKSLCGAILSLGIFTTVIIYAANKFNVMWEFEGTNY